MFRRSEPGVKEAMHYASLDGGAVECGLCHHSCVLKDGQRGLCGVRENRKGRLFTLVYGMMAYGGWPIDPIEKKPLFHFLPGASALSLGTAGCNLSCMQCQNHHMSTAKPPVGWLVETSEDEVARRLDGSGAEVLAWTYNEPTIWHEFTLPVSKLVRRMGKAVIYVTNGFMREEPLREIAPYMNAANVDVKGFTEEFYRKVTGARLAPVLENCLTMKGLGIHVELTYLVIPTLNDDAAQVRGFSRWVAEEMGPDTPVHFSRFHPEHRLAHLPSTPVETLVKARETAMEEGVRFVYVGNAPGLNLENTVCPICSATVVERYGFSAVSHLEGGRCPRCGESIPVVESVEHIR